MDEQQDVVLTQDAIIGEPEKTLPVSRVNEIVKREKLAAAEKARRELEAEYAAKSSMQSQSMGGMEIPDADKLYEQVYNKFVSEAQKQQAEVAQQEHQKAMKELADSYLSKMAKGKEVYPDFEEVVNGVNPASFEDVVYLVAQMDNTQDIMYELAKNPTKLAALDYMATRDPEGAKNQLVKLSESIAQNQRALAENVSTPAPLSRLKSSTVGADNGVMGLSDFKSASWLRG